MFRRLTAVLAALGLTIILAAPAVAVTVDLHQDTPINWNDEGVEVECEGEEVASGMVLWHFVAHTTTNDFTLDAEFGDGTVVTDMAPTKAVDAFELHWDVITTLTSLEDASITGSGTVNPGGFNLSHVCPNPGEVIPEAPTSALLILTAALLGGIAVVWTMRRSFASA